MLIISIVTAIIALLVLFFVPSGSTLFVLLLIAAIILAVIAMRKKKNGEKTKNSAPQSTPFYSTENSDDEDSEESYDNPTEDNDQNYDEDDTDDASYDITEDEIFIPSLEDDTLDDPFKQFVSKENDLTDELDDDSDAIYNLATDEESPIVMEIGDVFGISGRSAVLCGKLEYPVAKGDELNICREDGTIIYRAVRCEGIEKSHKKVDTANAGDSVGLLFTVDASPIERGMMIRG